MLVLTRGLKQKIVIGDQLVTVTVLEVKGGRVRLGTEAPENMSIRRQELVIENENENEADSLHPCLH